MAKAILLLSGGLDSTLAGKLLLEQGVEVEAVNFVSPFCLCTPRSLGCPAAKRAADQLGIPVKVVACGEDYLEVVKHPRFGRGKRMNPCLDCRIFMFRRAGDYMREVGADFIATGEVVGERPMSQRRAAMATIEREAGLKGLIVRPLSARLMAPTLPERERLVARGKFGAIRGRSRRPQMKLAERLGIRDYLCAAGGCLLTMREFAAKFEELLRQDPDFGLLDARLLRHGRHFRLPTNTKVILGKNERENAILEELATAEDLMVMPRTVPGPSALCRKSQDLDDAAEATRLVATYIKRGQRADMVVRRPGAQGQERVVEGAEPMSREEAAAWRVAAVERQEARA